MTEIGADLFTGSSGKPDVGLSWTEHRSMSLCLCWDFAIDRKNRHYTDGSRNVQVEEEKMNSVNEG